MNIQIFGRTKCFDTKKAQRYFKERKIPFQFVNLNEKDLSKGEFNSIKTGVGGSEHLIDNNSKDKETLALVEYISLEDKDRTILENQHLIKTPIVRNGKKSTVGYEPKIWEIWE